MPEYRITLPTLITLARIALIPFIMVAMVTHHWGYAFWLFIVAALTDTIDGNIARWLGEQTFLGACLDPIADKLLILSCFFTLAFIDSPFLIIPAWFFWFMLVKEVLLLGGAYVLYRRGVLSVNPSWLGKLSTLVQILFIVWLFVCHYFHWMPIKTYYVMLGVMIGLVFITLVHYAGMALRLWRIV